MLLGTISRLRTCLSILAGPFIILGLSLAPEPSGAAVVATLDAYSRVAPSVVYIQTDNFDSFGDALHSETVIGFIVKSNDTGSWVLTVAHGAVPGAVTTTYRAVRTYTSVVDVTGTVVRISDERDLTLLFFPDLKDAPVACLGDGDLSAADVGIATFSVSNRAVDEASGEPSPPPGTPPPEGTTTFPIAHRGIVAGMRSDLDGIVELSVNSEHGYSGSPVFDIRTGLVVANLQRALVEPDDNDPSQKSLYSTSTEFGRNALALRHFLDEEANLDVPFVPYTEAADVPRAYALHPYPDLTAEHRVAVITRDPPGGAGNPNVAYAQQAIESPFVHVLQDMFKAAVERVSLPSTDPAFATPASTGELVTTTCLNTQSAAALVVFRTIAAQGAGIGVRSTIVLYNCDGHAEGSVDTSRTLIHTPMAAGDPHNLRASVRDALSALSLGDPRRLQEFSVDGIFMAPGERQAFFRWRRIGDRLLTGPNFVDGYAFGVARVPDNFKITKIGSIDGAALLALTPAQFDGLASSAGDAGIDVVLDGNSTYHLVAQPRCYYYRSIATNFWENF
jgi:hypothetical protein